MTSNKTESALQKFDPTMLSSRIGFDNIFYAPDIRVLRQASSNYPPYNIIKTGENSYRIELAVAGFRRDEITVEVENSIISIKGEHMRAMSPDYQYLYRGLSGRNFDRVFQIDEHVIVQSATMQDGILAVELERIVPEEKKARIIDIIEVK
jgi:molecular chaperone IbpA